MIITIKARAEIWLMTSKWEKRTLQIAYFCKQEKYFKILNNHGIEAFKLLHMSFFKIF